MIEFTKLYLKFRRLFALSQVLRELLAVAEPDLTGLPMDVLTAVFSG